MISNKPIKELLGRRFCEDCHSCKMEIDTDGIHNICLTFEGMVISDSREACSHFEWRTDGDYYW